MATVERLVVDWGVDWEGSLAECWVAQSEGWLVVARLEGVARLEVVARLEAVPEALAATWEVAWEAVEVRGAT